MKGKLIRQPSGMKCLRDVYGRDLHPAARPRHCSGFAGSVPPRMVARDLAGKVVDGPAEAIGAEAWGTGGDLGISRDGTTRNTSQHRNKQGRQTKRASQCKKQRSRVFHLQRRSRLWFALAGLRKANG